MKNKLSILIKSISLIVVLNFMTLKTVSSEEIYHIVSYIMPDSGLGCWHIHTYILDVNNQVVDFCDSWSQGIGGGSTPCPPHNVTIHNFTNSQFENSQMVIDSRNLAILTAEHWQNGNVNPSTLNLSISPSPSSGNVTVAFNSTSSGHALFLIVDEFGIPFFNGSINVNEGSNTINIDMSAAHNGSYTFSLATQQYLIYSSNGIIIMK